MLNKATAVFVIVVLSLAAACGPSAPTPTPTPQPTPTPVWVLATKPEHLVGTWYNPGGTLYGMGPYYRFEVDGTVKRGETLEQLQQNPFIEGTCWFEGEIYYEVGQMCEPIA